MSEYRQSQCQTMLEALERAGVAGMTRKEFADLLRIKKGSHLNGLIDELMTRQLAFKANVKDKNNRPMYLYIHKNHYVQLPLMPEEQ